MAVHSFKPEGNMSTDRIYYLLQQFFHQQCTPEEKEELALWIDMLRNDEEWKLHLGRIWNSYEPDEKIDPVKADRILKEIISEAKEQVPGAKTIRPFYKRWLAVAAVGLLIAATFIYFLMKPSGTSTRPGPAKMAKVIKDIAPGSNKAILTLANGSSIILDSIQNGTLMQQGNTKVVKVNNGLLAYETKSSYALNPSKEKRKAKSEVSYNTLTTPRGGLYRLVLPDGSKVWLNAASILRFPTSFTGKERKVEISGEAYFEITQNADRPFTVNIVSRDGKLNGSVKVLGTHFNINAYSDESAVKTTLLKGAIRIIAADSKKVSPVLSPGEQVVMNSAGNIYMKMNVNTNEAVAWKNGLFDFEGNDIQSVMRQIARWYNVSIKYENIPSAHFMGTISRSVNVSEVLKMLEMTGVVHFRVEGRKITVTK
jgi:ferric-dicitrate binding protein FerR (iron transport regulator)